MVNFEWGTEEGRAIFPVAFSLICKEVFDLGPMPPLFGRWMQSLRLMEIGYNASCHKPGLASQEISSHSCESKRSAALSSNAPIDDWFNLPANVSNGTVLSGFQLLTDRSQDCY
ncbi:hypothetical protein SUGI_0072610 [Cryptomeria japonica]|nr:hypothetical protein SUGI_0072610 [Cryptomeria japonica]